MRCACACGNPVKARGLCATCYKNATRRGTLPPLRPRRARVVSCPGDVFPAGGSFKMGDVRLGLLPILLDGVIAEAWPVGMVWSIAGRRMRVHRNRDGRLSLVFAPDV